MAFVTPRASGLWEDRMSYFQSDDEADDDVEQAEALDSDGRTPLDRTIDRIGMGAFVLLFSSLPVVTREYGRI
ncbi:hypothetical protein EWM64_g3888 [Hericium alpestre]|uniref:Uncharacterized protein n=1 Tax=Hericium alpestre TaxID=135208 RepID=A0A4Z0A350_9AGAM|nr:hypothetical protein EWM64_g3888 [Hericium alpestre]